MELLFGPSVAVLAVVSSLAVVRLAPFFSVLDIRTGRGAVLELPRTAPFVFAIVILRTSVALAAETWWPLTWLRLIIR